MSEDASTESILENGLIPSRTIDNLKEFCSYLTLNDVDLTIPTRIEYYFLQLLSSLSSSDIKQHDATIKSKSLSYQSYFYSFISTPPITPTIASITESIHRVLCGLLSVTLKGSNESNINSIDIFILLPAVRKLTVESFRQLNTPNTIELDELNVINLNGHKIVHSDLNVNLIIKKRLCIQNGDLDDTFFQQLHSLVNTIKELDLSFNKFTHIITTETLTILKMEYNCITSLAPTMTLHSLKELHLRGNKVIDFNGLAQFKNLEFLDVRDNLIECVPDFTGLFSISKILMTENPLVS